VASYRERHGVSGAKSDAADAHTLATWCAPIPTTPHGRIVSVKPPLDIQTPGMPTATWQNCWPKGASWLIT
jgi:hypothetical protein